MERKLFATAPGVAVKLNYMVKYAARLRKMICDAVGKTEEEKPLSGYKIAVDAGNGAGRLLCYGCT